ncbi:MAG TPA: substrate-binding domain-containing protein, partial [Dehalococcoidia bacterium]|nr:substrate-binding domain-containing protein [Dehalococcoidia bacterium]
GEADVLLVHAPKAEEAFMSQGYGVNRRLVMHNDFVIVGPPEDPAGIRGLDSAAAAFQRLAQARARFASRDDDSGTHKKEREIWAQLGIDPGRELSYIETGQGMGQTLLIADEKRSYTLSDRATYLAFRLHLDLEVLVEGDPSLRNIYHVMQVNPQKYPKVNAAGAKAFVDFITSPEIQGLIGSFGVAEYGQPLFVPDAHLEAGTSAAD